MAKLFILMCGNAKDRMHPIMIDVEQKCRNYQKARESSQGRKKHYSLAPAPEGATVWRKDTSSQWTNYNSPDVPLVRKRK